jgi:Domain of unknown function (DUF1996)
VSNEELRRLLVGAVPQAPPPADRWTQVAERVRRRRNRHLGTALAVLLVAVLGAGTAMARILPSARGPGSGPAGVQPDSGPAGVQHATVGPSPTSAPPKLAGVPYDASRIPVGSPGSPDERVVRTGELPSPSHDGNAIFRTVCLFSQMNTDEPLPVHGEPDSSYLHLYWGNTAVRANPTAGSLAKGNSTCRGGTVDRSAYWVPALIDTRIGAPIAPELIHVYFESGYLGVRPDQVKPMPGGLRMVAGEAAASTGHGQVHAGWVCWSAFRDRVSAIPTCHAGDSVAMELTFPQCWNGRDLDSADHRAHMAYAMPGHGCPATHPVALPQISYHVLYPVTAGTDTSRWRLATDTIQGGWINGWKEEIEATWIRGCVNVPVTCGSHMLGDGRVLRGDR